MIRWQSKIKRFNRKALYSILIKWHTDTTNGPTTYPSSHTGGQHPNLTGLKIRHRPLEHHRQRNEDAL